jgi:hypothetical protein
MQKPELRNFNSFSFSHSLATKDWVFRHFGESASLLGESLSSSLLGSLEL